MKYFKKLFKGFLAFALVCSVVTTLSSAVSAGTRGDETYVMDESGIEMAYVNNLLATAENVADKTAYVTLVTGGYERVVIPEGYTVTLDLNGNTLVAALDHTITNYGTLTIVDSVGGGVVDNVTHGKAAIFNDGGIVTLNGGTYTRSEENGISSSDNGGNSYYNIENYGTMVIEGDTEVTQSGSYSSMIHNGWYYSEDVEGNAATLTIKSGTFTGGLNTVKNDEGGYLTIDGGIFTNTAQHAILNWNIATITGGTFTTTSEAGTIFNGYSEATSIGQLTITGGTFLDETLIKIYGNDTSTTITGGDFIVDVTSYLTDEYTCVENEAGTYTVYSKQSLAISYAEELINGIDGVLEAGISEEDAIAEMTILLEEVAEKIDSTYVIFSYRFYEYVASTVNEEGSCTFDYSVVFGSMGAGGMISMAIEKLPETTTDTNTDTDTNADDDTDATVTPSIDTAVSTDETTTELAPTIESSTLASIFTTDELEGNEAISVNLAVKEIAKEDLSEEETTVIEEALASLENTMVHAIVLDLTLDKVVGTTVTNITELTDAIRITINIPEEFLGLSEEYVIVRVHEGVATILKDLDDDDKTITFETDCFSTYSIAYADTSVDATVDTDTEVEDDVDTGDTTNVATLLSLLLLSAAGLLVVRKRA